MFGAGFEKTAQPLLVDAHVGEAAEEGEAPVALADEVRGCQRSTAMVVGRDRRNAAVGQAPHDEYDRNVGRLDHAERVGGGAVRGRDDQAGDALLHQRFQHFLLPHRVFGGVGDEGNDAGRLEHALDADRHFGEERVGQVVDDHADDVGMGLAQIGGAAVVDVADVLDRLAHPDHRFGANKPAALKDERYRRFGHARLAGNVEYRRLGPAGHSFSAPVIPGWIIGTI